MCLFTDYWYQFLALAASLRQYLYAQLYVVHFCHFPVILCRPCMAVIAYLILMYNAHKKLLLLQLLKLVKLLNCCR